MRRRVTDVTPELCRKVRDLAAWMRANGEIHRRDSYRKRIAERYQISLYTVDKILNQEKQNAQNSPR